MHIIRKPQFKVSCYILALVFSCLLSISLLAPKSYASQADYTFDDLSNSLNVNVYTFCATSYQYVDGVHRYIADYQTTATPVIHSSVGDDGIRRNYFTVSSPAGCTGWWGINEIYPTTWGIGSGNYTSYMALSSRSFFHGATNLTSTLIGYVNNSTYDVMLHTAGWSWYSLARDDGYDLNTRYQFYEGYNEDSGDLESETIILNFNQTGLPNDVGGIYGSFGSTCKYIDENGVWRMGYFGNESCPLGLYSTNQVSVLFTLTLGYSSNSNDFLIDDTDDVSGLPTIDDAMDANTSLGNISLSILNPISGFLALFTDSECVSLSVIPGWFGLGTTQVCSPWYDNIRPVLTPIFNFAGTMLVFGFCVSWLRGRHGFDNSVRVETY